MRHIVDSAADLPSSPPLVPLGEVVRFIRGVSFKTGDARRSQANDDVPILRAGNIADELHTWRDLIWVDRRFVSDEQYLRPGDVVICMSSGSPAVVGKTAQLMKDWRGSVGAFCGIVRPATGVDARYLGHWFKSQQYFDWRDSQTRGANIQNLRFSTLAGIHTPLPPLEEQRRIVERLDAQMAELDRAREASNDALALIKTTRSALLREAFDQ